MGVLDIKIETIKILDYTPLDLFAPLDQICLPHPFGKRDKRIERIDHITFHTHF